jgi:C-terminal processing protease CtpA/Prc
VPAIEVAPAGIVAAAAVDDLGRSRTTAVEAYIQVDATLAGSAANGADLRVGDRIVRINGLPISSGVREDPRATLYGHPGTTLRLTVERPAQDGTSLIEIEWVRPYVPNPFTEAPETPAHQPR